MTSDKEVLYLFHPFEDGRLSDDARGLLYDLLVPPLHGAVPPEEGDGVPVLVPHELHLQVAGRLRQFHDENRGPWHLVLHLKTKRHN